MILVALIMILLALFQLPSLINRKQWAELAGYALVWLMAAAYALLVAAQVPIPRPLELLRSLLEAIYNWLGLEITL